MYPSQTRLPNHYLFPTKIGESPWVWPSLCAYPIVDLLSFFQLPVDQAIFRGALRKLRGRAMILRYTRCFTLTNQRHIFTQNTQRGLCRLVVHCLDRVIFRNLEFLLGYNITHVDA